MTTKDKKTITVDGIEYVRADSVTQQINDGPVKIIVLEGRWNIVGRYSVDGDEGVLDDAAVIRYWGTTKGLGEIAAGGPTSKTILDKTNGQVRFPLRALVIVLNCDESKWSL